MKTNQTVNLNAGDHTPEALEAAAHNWYLMKDEWCKCGTANLLDDLGGSVAYFRDPESGSHGWLCANCLGIVQTG